MKHFLIAIMLPLTGMLSCHTADNPQPDVDPPLIPRADIVLTDAERQVNIKTQDFAFNVLHSVVAGDDADKNFIVSPLSLSMALSMLDNGAAGTTEEEIRSGLGFGNASREAMNTYAQKLVKAMQELDTRSTFEAANSIWIQNNFPVFDAFKQTNADYYDAEVRNIDFSDPSTVGLVNDWIEDKTHNMIKDMIDKWPVGIRLCLVNALYFKGTWASKFHESNTGDEIFHNADGTSPSVPTMHKGGIYEASVQDGYKVLALPFGNGAFSMYFILPDEGVALKDVARLLNEQTWSDCMADLQAYQGRMAIPRFKLEYERSLVEDLKGMGMTSMFDKTKADFSLITEITDMERLFVADVLQKASVEVSESGAKAAAATVIEMGVTSTGPTDYPKMDFIADRPFLFMIREWSTGTIFFTGAVNAID